jgi:uncharacterized membrane protein
MLALLIVSLLLGILAASAFDAGFIGVFAGIVFFICGLPFALIFSCVYGVASYTQDRADYRQMLSELHAEELAEEHEIAEDARADRIIKSSKTPMAVYHDNRQVHIHGTEGEFGWKQ